MLEITKQKLEILKEIFILTNKQAKALENMELKAFLAFSEDKRLLIKKVNQLDKLFEKQYNAIKQPAKDGDFAQAIARQVDLKEIQEVIKRIQTLTDKIQEMESRNKEAYNDYLQQMMVTIKKSQIDKQDKILRYKKMNDYKKNR